MLYFYEIKNKETQERKQTAAKDFATACKLIGWKAHKCRCIWKASVENGY